MLPDLDETLRQLLTRDLPIANGEVEVSFDQPKRDWAAGRVKPTVNLYLYDLLENAELRRSDWVVERNGNGQATKRQPPKRVDATYMVTTWAGAVEDEHRLLWRVLAVLLRHGELPRDLLHGELANAKEPLTTTVLGHDDVPNPGDLWTALGNDLRPALHYRVVLPLDVAQRFVGPLVTTKVVRVQEGLEQGRGPFEEILQVAGTVCDDQGRPVAGAEVAVKDSALRATTDAAGRYTFPNLEPGSYTFIVTAPGRKAREQKVVVPPPAAGRTAVPYDLGI